MLHVYAFELWVLGVQGSVFFSEVCAELVAQAHTCAAVRFHIFRGLSSEACFFRGGKEVSLGFRPLVSESRFTDLR